MSLKYSKLEKLNFEFNERKKILNDFENFKNSLFKTFDKINQNSENITKQVFSLRKTAENIERSNNTIYLTHIKTIENKLNNYKIEKKLLKPIRNIENKNN